MQCKRAFEKRKYLLDHIKDSHVKPLKCELCDLSSCSEETRQDGPSHAAGTVHQFPVAATTSSTTALSQSSTVTYTSAQTATTLPMATVTSVERSSTVPSATTPIPTLDTDDIQLGEDFMNCNRVMDDISLNCVVATSDPTVSLFDSQCPTPCLDEQPQPALFPDLLSVELFSPLKLALSPLEN